MKLGMKLALPALQIESELETEVKQLRTELDAVLRVLWSLRGLAYQEGGKIEKELDAIHSKYLERSKDVTC